MRKHQKGQHRAAQLVPRACLWNRALGLVFCGFLTCRGQGSEALGPPWEGIRGHLQMDSEEERTRGCWLETPTFPFKD